MTELEIIKGCKRGKRSYQKALYDKYASLLLGICYRYFPDYDLANDLLQEVFIKIFDKISGFRNEGSLEGWLKRITVNMAINELKKQRNRFNQVALEDGMEVEDIHFDDAKDLLDMVSELPDGYREIFNLHAIEGYPFKDIGDILSMTEGNVRVRYHRARKTLQKKLNKHFLS